MGAKAGIPDDPLSFIKGCVEQQHIYWTYHINMRMKERSLSRQEIIESVEKYEVIESYPKDKYLPAYLVWAQFNDDIFHIVCC